MVSTFTPNIQLEEPARGDQVGVWDTPVNSNMTLLDLVAGNITTISLNNSNIVLSAAQFRSRLITTNSTLTGSITLTFPTSFVKDYIISNVCTGSSANTITLQTTATGGQVICAPPGQAVQVYNDGTNLKFLNFGGPIGSYWDYGGSSNPAWNTGCTVPPYLIANGSSFSATTYPGLALVFPGLVLPDTRGRVRFALDQSAGNISSGTGGFSGSSVGATGGAQATTLGTSNLPAYTPSGSVTASVPSNPGLVQTPSGPVNIGGTGSGGTVTSATLSGTFTGNAQGGVSQAFTNLSPGVIAGLTLIRAG